MEMLSGAEMVVRSLIDQGVKQVFGYPGGAVLDIYDALHTVGGIDHVLVRHEQAAVHMADGLARATGEVGVVLVTSGPGATNAITGIATAYMDSIPLVVLSGQVATSLIGYDAFQECDMVGISRPVVKHSFLVKQTEDIPQVLKKAVEPLRAALAGKAVASIAAGWTMQQLTELLPDSRICRIMPNTPAMVGAGMTAIAQESTFTEQEFSCIQDIFASIGRVTVVPEHLMNAGIRI